MGLFDSKDGSAGVTFQIDGGGVGWRSARTIGERFARQPDE